MNKMTLHIRASNCAIKEASGFIIGLYNMAAYGAYQNIILCMAYVAHLNSMEKNIQLLLIEPLGRLSWYILFLGKEANRPVAKPLANKIRSDKRVGKLCRTNSRNS